MTYQTTDIEDVCSLLNESSGNVGYLTNALEHIGRLPSNFDCSCFLPYLEHENHKIRQLAVKNIGKVHPIEFLDKLVKIGKGDPNTMVRREAVSSIGRMKSEQAKNTLKKFLNDTDPKIVCQAIRGLLVFKGEPTIDNTLKSLKNHENEVVRNVIEKEYFKKDEKKFRVFPHTDIYPFLKNVMVNGDVREVLKHVPEESVHLTFTSPPYYNARDYSIYPSYEAYLKFLEEVFKETFRITKEGRFLVVNTSPVIVPRISRAHSSTRYPIPFDINEFLVKMGWDFIDDIIWMKPEYSVKNRIGGFQQHRKPLAYKPNCITEYLMVYRKHTDKLIDWNIRQYSSEVIEKSKVKEGYETTNVWQINPRSDKIHSAVFPAELCQKVIEYYSFKGDLIFDPFGGSGTLGRVALANDRYFFMTELDKEYYEYAASLFNEDVHFSNKCKCFSIDEFKTSTL